jgi:mono/diheme cytochrome c family protein
MRPVPAFCAFPLAALFFLPASVGAVAPPGPSIGAADYLRDVKPILAKHCVTCHGPDKQRASLRLDSATALRQGGNSGPVVVPGKSAESLLVKAILCAEGVKAMPPKGPRLTPVEIATLRAWIDAGATVPPGEGIASARTRSRHWAFQPIRRPELPAVKDASWPRNGIDRFILARLDREQVIPSPQADRITLLRRVHLDLTGIPPTPAEIDAFLADTRADAYERAVERLLASPHYGERWARHWLDQARYADSNGYSIDSPRTIWKYRDWVIDAFNRDLPFDRFTIEQLAGDLLPGATVEQKIATGFQRNTQINEEGGIDLEQFRVEAVIDRTNTVGTVFLGLTLGCAQCHDHKFDPITQKEYYQIYSFFNHGSDPKLELVTEEVKRQRQQLQAEVARLEANLLALDAITTQKLEKWEGGLSVEARASLPKAIQSILAIAPNGRNPRQEQALLDAYRNIDQTRHVIGGLPGPWFLAVQTQIFQKRKALEVQILARKKQVPATVSTLVLDERQMARMTTVQLGGDFLRKGALVVSDVPSVLPPLPRAERPTRLDLAKWLVERDNPLPSRVLVNRHWQHFFGLGLVETENDFGTQGQKPSHPELLDWLASEFMERGWSMKALHRLIVTSATYRQASRSRPDLATLDPRNRLLARQNRFRLEAEVVRDVALSASGLLTRTIGGPGIYPPQPKGVYSFTQVPRTWTPSTGPERYRRGMYTFFWRSAPHPNLVVFDAPDATASCTRRNRSNTPLQALTLLNDEAFFECARALAGRVLTEAGSRDEDRLDHAFRLVVGRRPSPRERSILTRLLHQQREVLARSADEAKNLAGADFPSSADPLTAASWTSLARVLLNLDEFITRE